MFNPRFPHTFTAWRSRLDSNSDPLTDDAGNPVVDRVRFDLCELRDYEPVRDANGNFVTYDGGYAMPFGYRTSSENTRKQADVQQGSIRLACPMFLTELKSGDRLLLTDYNRQYWVTVVKQTTFNLGTNVWVTEEKG